MAKKVMAEILKPPSKERNKYIAKYENKYANDTAYTIRKRSLKAENLRMPLNVLNRMKKMMLKKTSVNVRLIPSVLTSLVNPSNPYRNRKIPRHEKIIMKRSIKKMVNLERTLLDK